MAKEKRNLQKELKAYQFEYGLLQKIPCSNEENKAYLNLLKAGQPLPDGVFRATFETGEESDEFYTVYEAELTDEEKKEYLTYKKLSLLKTIKNCVVFFTVLTIISLVACVFFILNV